MNDGSEEEYGPGDVTYIPPGHKAWVVRDAEDGPELFTTSCTTVRGELKENIYN
jgi:quercetin dioxygenase-like cupin family protein